MYEQLPPLQYNAAQRLSFRHGHGDTHEVGALLDFLRRPRFESSFSVLCRRRDRPRFFSPALRHTDTKRTSGKSHTAFGLMHVDIGLRTIFLPVTFFTTQSTLGSRHEALFQRDTLAVEGALAVTLALPSLATFTPLSTFASFALALVGRVFAVFSLTSTKQPTSLTGQRGRKRNHGPEATSSQHLVQRVACLLVPQVGFVQALISTAILPLRKSQECRSLTNHGGSSQTLFPSWFPGQLPARRRKSRPNRFTRRHLLPGSSSPPRALARSCPCC